MQKTVTTKSKYLNGALALFLGGLVFLAPLWLFGAEKAFLPGKATILATNVRGLIPRSKRRDPHLSDRKNETYIYAKSDAEADSFAVDLDCLFQDQKVRERFKAYYFTYPTRVEAEVEAKKLIGQQISIHYDPANQHRCILDGEFAEDTSLVPIFTGLVGAFMLGALVCFVKSLSTF
jgi:hypothetical protein